MQPVGLSENQGLACMKCGRRAAFLCPLGALCPTDALLAAARHGWIPTHIGAPSVDRIADETADTDLLD